MKQLIQSRFKLVIPWWALAALDMIEDTSLIILGCVAGLIAAHQSPDLVGEAQKFGGAALGFYFVLQLVIITIRYFTKEAD